MIYPENKKFAFTILDDTDDATRESVEPIYQYLYRAGFRTTKTVWPMAKNEGQKSLYDGSSDLTDDEYLVFVKELIDRGFEVTWHGPAMESSDRKKIQEGIEIFREKLGFIPSLHVNHSCNKDNMYWGEDRFDSWLIKLLLMFSGVYRDTEYSGQREGSQYYWGDIAKKHFKYCRGFAYPELNVLNINPSIPYSDKIRSNFEYWFSTSDASSVLQFEEIFTVKNMNKLIDEKGMCIVSTHLGKGFCKGGEVKDSVKRILDHLAHHDGWFVPVSEMLDWRLIHGGGGRLSRQERLFMEFKWLAGAIKQKYF